MRIAINIDNNCTDDSSYDMDRLKDRIAEQLHATYGEYTPDDTILIVETVNRV